eukprot:g7429.t1
MNLARMRSINLGMSIHSAGLDWSHIDIQLQELPLDTAGDVTPELFLDTASNASPESSLPVSVPKPRPLNVADKYKIVGGVPAFVWKPFQGFSSLCRVYAISSDGTHIAIQEHWTLICVYNMQENFSFVAKWEDISYQRVVMFTFHNDKNNQLVVVFEDSTVALLHVAMNSEDSIEEPSTSEQQSGAIGIGKWFKMLINYAGMRLGFSISNKGCETWVLAEDWNFVRSITLLSIVGEEFRLLKIKSKEDIMSVFDYHSIAHNALMLVQFENNETSTLRTKTIIYNDIDFTKDVIEELPTTLENGQTFGFSECGRYFLIWTHNNVGENAIVFYGIRHLKRSGRLIARRPIGRDILIVRGHFIKRQHNAVELFGVEFENHQMVAYLVANTNQVSLMFWHPPTHTIVRKFNVTMKEVELQNPIHIEFSISSNAKWVAVGYYTQGIFGLFSIVTRSLVWSIKLNTNNRLLDAFIPLAFDGSSTKLIINACETLYVVCPPCLIEDYKLHFHQTTYDLIQDNRKQMISLQIHHQNLIPKDMLKEMLILKYGKENVFVRWLLDISCSRITPALAFLFKLNEKLLVIQEPMRTMETQIFKNDFTCASEVEDALRGLRGLVVDESLSCNPKTLQNKNFAWIFLYANEERDGDLMVVFLYQLGLLGCFIDTENHMQQDRVRFSDQEPYILRQTKNGNQISCLFDFGVTVIDLKARETIHNVEYKVRQEWLSFIPSSYRKESFLDVIDDGNTIIIGWDVKKKNLLTLTSRTEEEECNNMIIKDWNIDLKQNKDNRDIVPCWMFHEESKRIAFLDFTEDYEAISSVCIYDMKNNNLKRIDRATWNPHSEKILDLMTSEHLYAYTLHLDESNGHLWIIALQNGDDTNCMICKPISPYSLGNCIPCLNIIDHSTKQIVELKELGLKFGHALSTMMFNGKTNFRLALENKNMSLMTTLADITEKNGASSCELVLKEFGKEVFKECLDNLVEDKDEFGMMLLLNLIKNEVIPFAESAPMMEHGIQKLWMKYQSLIEPRIIENAMVRKICEIEVPVNVLIKSKNVLAMMGTHDSIPLEWEEQDGQMNGKIYMVNNEHGDNESKFEDESKDNEVRQIMEQSFGDPWKTIITLFYAMIGTFEPQIYYNTGSFSFIITIIFVLYLSTQMIVMINMLIAIMGDTFDRVKSIEEEQLLMGRARFIDACEAQLSTTNIKKIEDSIGKYLYCLVPKEGERIDEIKLWQGRVKTIEEKVSKTIKDSQREVTTQISNIKDEIKGEIKDMKKGFTEIKQVKHNVEKMKCDIDEIKQMLRNPI